MGLEKVWFINGEPFFLKAGHIMQQLYLSQKNS